MTPGTDVQRAVELAIVPAVVALAVALPIPLAGDLPDPIATHWNLAGDADGSMPATALWLGSTGVWLALWGFLVWRARRADARRGARMPEAVAVHAAGGLLAASMLLTVAVNRGAPDWRAADAGPVTLVVIAGLVLGGGVAWWCERGRPWSAAAEPGAPGGRPTVGLTPGERAVWTGEARSRWMIFAGVAVAGAMAAVGILAGPPTSLTMFAGAVVVAVVTTWVSTVHTTVTAEGVRIGFGPLRRPVRVVALDDIEGAEAIAVEPLQWGGWGYRWAGRGRTGVIVRRGPGVLLRLRDGRRMAITVDGAAQAAGLVNDLLARPRRPAERGG